MNAEKQQRSGDKPKEARRLRHGAVSQPRLQCGRSVIGPWSGCTSRTFRTIMPLKNEGQGSEMRSWLRRRRERRERLEAEANPFILDLGATAYSQARGREYEASSDPRARQWSRVALAVARKTGQAVGLNASTSNGDGRQLGGAIPDLILWRSDQSRTNHLGGSRPAGFRRVHSNTPSGSRWMASSRDRILPDRSRRPRSLRTAEGRLLVGAASGLPRPRRRNSGAAPGRPPHPRFKRPRSKTARNWPNSDGGASAVG